MIKILYATIFSFITCYAIDSPEVSYDSLQGVVIGTNKDEKKLLVKLRDGEKVKIQLAEEVITNNLGNDDPVDSLYNKTGYTVFISGLVYPHTTELVGEQITVIGKEKYPFEENTWWSKQAESLAAFWIRAQFDACLLDNFLNPLDCTKKPIPLNAHKYQTSITKGGFKRRQTLEDQIQETAVLSRLIFGLCSSYLLTGKSGILKAAKALVDYQRTYMRQAIGNDQVYWIHALSDGKKIIASLQGDDLGTIPLYEQIYCLAGLTQYYRITKDKEIFSDIKKTMNFMDKKYWDNDKLGYFSHIDPKTLDPLQKTLGINQAKKNWNSIGDHLPAFLMNLYLATNNPLYLKRLVQLGDLIVTYFHDANSPFVFERFDQNWQPDLTYSWQQNRGVTGHNLKIAWCLTGLYELSGKKSFLLLAERAADLMLDYGEDTQRGGWYDVMSRNDTNQRHVWSNRKSWWQQEQGILAYYMLYSVTKDERYLSAARRGAAFYNLSYLDKRDGGVYFDVTATGLPYIDNDIRADKGSHSKGGYHELELAYNAQLYTTLFVEKKDVNLYFQPLDKNKTLFVQPIPFPKDSVLLTAVTINGKPYKKFNPDTLAIQLPSNEQPLNIRCTLSPKTVNKELN